MGGAGRPLFLVGGLALAGFLFPQDLRFYDPAALADEAVAAPSGAVTLTLNPDGGSLSIPPHFYGVNETILPAGFAFRIPGLVKALKPDVIRLFTQKQTVWTRVDGVAKREDFPLSPARGEMRWAQLDAHVQAILDAGAKPYVAMGFGAPTWLSDGEKTKFPRPPRARLAEYAAYMAEILRHLAVERGFPIRWASIDNEPENVQYPIEDYLELVRLAAAAIRQAAPGVQIAGPATGYATWAQPDGRSLSFASSSAYLAERSIAVDLVDWHVYSKGTSTVLRTASILEKAYGPMKPRVLSELNRDWRYGPKDQAAAISNNTGWDSVSWLLTLFDHLQRAGVSQVHYFDLISTPFGLLDYGLTQARPNYFSFWACTSLLGRHRISLDSGHPAIGAIATREGKTITALIYNRASNEVRLAFRGMPAGAKSLLRYDQAWYKSHKTIVEGKVEFPGWVPSVGDTTVPAGGFVAVRWEE